MLGVARTIGETMAVTITCRATPKLTINPLESISTMTAHIVQLSNGKTEIGPIVHRSIFAIAFSLFLITLTISTFSQWILSRYREVYQ